MKQARNPIRLFVEILLIVAAVQAAVTLGLPAVAAGLPARSQALLGAALLALLAGPTIYWRCMAGTGQVSTPSSDKGPRSSSVGSATAPAPAMPCWARRADAALD